MGECERLCYEEHNCVSINFERKKDGDGKYHCELNNSTHREHDQDLVDTENYFYRGTKVTSDDTLEDLSDAWFPYHIIVTITMIVANVYATFKKLGEKKKVMTRPNLTEL